MLSASFWFFMGISTILVFWLNDWLGSGDEVVAALSGASEEGIDTGTSIV
jgi:hypothetical protein